MTARDGKEPKTGLTYAAAGVDIDAGNAMVETIKPLVRSTRRPGADAEIGGFGGLFDLKAAGFRDPILVAANDGVGTKVKIAIETGRHDTIGVDLVAMCVNDIIVQGAEPLFFLDYYATGKLVPGVGADIVKRHRRGLPTGRLRAHRRRDRRDAGPLRRRPTTISPDSRWALPSAARLLPRAGIQARRRGAGPALVRSPFQRLLAGPPDRRQERPRLGRAGAVCLRPPPRRGAAGADPDLREAVARRRWAPPTGSGRWPTSPAAASPTTSPGSCRTRSASRSTLTP